MYSCPWGAAAGSGTATDNNGSVEQVAEVDTGMTGLERLEEQSVNLVVTDYNMPDMDSQRLVDCIRNRRADPHPAGADGHLRTG